MKEIGVGLLGFGTVGAGVVEGLQKNGDLLAERTGVRLVLRRVADIDLTRDRGVKVAPEVLTTDAEATVREAAVDIVVELVGGTTAAKDLTLTALGLGKPVVTANKALLAEHGAEIFKVAAAKGTAVFFEASVAGGVPIIRALREGLVANRIRRIYGILNGTCNYVLTRMDREGMTFEHALKEAQLAGYAEADPRLDIDGVDTAHKAVILASLAYGVHVPMSAVHIEGLRGLARADLEYARGLGYSLKLLAVIKNVNGETEVRVHPTLLPADHMLASVPGVFNAVMVEGDIVGQTVYYGRGAGRYPTASAVLSDLADAARRLAFSGGMFGNALPCGGTGGRFRPIGEVETRYYLRLALMDRPGVLGRVATILGRHDISLASVLQKEPHRTGRYVPVVVLTHPAREHHVDTALEELARSDAVGGKPVRLRIEDLEAE